MTIEKERKRGAKMMAETKKEKFVRIATARTNKTLDAIRSLKNCANKNTYEYTSEEVEKIFSALDGALAEARAAFQQDAKRTFSLS